MSVVHVAGPVKLRAAAGYGRMGYGRARRSNVCSILYPMPLMKTSAAVLGHDRPALARAISLIENGRPGADQLHASLLPHCGRAHIVGITGAPGAGKSSLINALLVELLRRGRRIAVLAVDPSSPVSGGALLGDRVRMTDHGDSDAVFIRSVSSRGHLGGLSRTTGRIIDLFDAAGFDTVIVETVGTGQSEVEIGRYADTRIVVCPPGQGDEVQALKAGILEIADILVVNKGDLPAAQRTLSDLQATPRHPAASGWQVPVLRTVATSGEGVSALIEQFEAHARCAGVGQRLTARGKLGSPRIAALVLAAGRSTRMGGSNKLLASAHGVPLALRATNAAAASRATSVTVVTGFEAEKIEAMVAGPRVAIVRNPDYAEGMSASLRCGIQALPADSDGVVVLLADMPQITAAHIDALIDAYAAGPAIIVPMRAGRRGNPILWPRRHFAAMQTIGGDRGARELLAQHAAEVVAVEMADDAIFADVDTPEDLAALSTAAGSDAGGTEALPEHQDMEWVHTRQITCRGYRRRDGWWQIEASVADEKGQSVAFKSRPDVSPGELIHHLSLCVVIDDDYQIRDVTAKTLAAPWPVCAEVAADYRKLIGLRIDPGFTRAVRKILGGTLGCTHLTDLLGQIGNTYMQASWPDRVARQKLSGEDPRRWPDTRTLSFVDGCHAWRKDGPVLAGEYPQLATGEIEDPPAKA